jgi:membrane associated rhomboid family serine protease
MRRNWNSPPRGYYGMGGGIGLTRGVKILLITNAVIFLIQQFTGGYLTQTLGVTPTKVLQDLWVYQVFTYMFLHGSFFHILINMFILWMFGREIELAWGTKRFFKYYFLTGIAGGIFTVAFQPNFAYPTIGASGAIYGLLAAYAVMFPNRTIYLYFLIPIKVKYAVILFVLLEFFASMSATPDGVGHWAHLGGAVVGFLYLKADWRISNFLRYFSPWYYWKRLKYRKDNRKLKKNRQKAEDIMKRVDQILDKINDVGFENISEEERRFLDDASELLSRKDT